ncbi:MAG: hypothetical protein C3F19_02520 [Rhodocyclales bacterium]|nr:MAG: hypothetical protein C3F19_02520 [Rhodocyclales bacterium]
MSRRKGRPDSTFQKLPLEVLSIEALNKVLSLQQAYVLEIRDYEGRLARNAAKKIRLERELLLAEQQGNAHQKEMTQLYSMLAPYKVGVIGKWMLTEPPIKVGVGFGASHYKREAQPLIDKLGQVYKQRDELQRLVLSLQEQIRNVVNAYEFKPKREAKLRHQSQTFVFDIGAISSEDISRMIEKKKIKATLERELEQSKHERVRTKLEQTKAKAAAYESKQRELAKSVRTALMKELHNHPFCPYCNEELSAGNAHADHIHPVAKGGLSTKHNMVFICQSCNMEKGALTLRTFLKKMNFIEAEVYERLDRMGKDV